MNKKWNLFFTISIFKNSIKTKLFFHIRKLTKLISTGQKKKMKIIKYNQNKCIFFFKQI